VAPPPSCVLPMGAGGKRARLEATESSLSGTSTIPRGLGELPRLGQVDTREGECRRGSGQSIHLTCDDNNAQSGDVVGEGVIEAIPVARLANS
jgi:hypothetical protein